MNFYKKIKMQEGEKDLEKAAKILAAYGPKEIVLTQKKEITWSHPLFSE